MSLLKKIGMPLAIVAGLSGCNGNSAEYSKEIDGMKVHYFWDSRGSAYNPFRGDIIDTMRVVKGDTILTFIDALDGLDVISDGEELIESRSTHKDLDAVRDEVMLGSAEIGSGPFYGNITARAWSTYSKNDARFPPYERLYNKLRRQLVDSLRKDRDDRISEVQVSQ